jgi:hypothetical protein
VVAIREVVSGRISTDQLIEQLMHLPPAPFVPLKREDFRPEEGQAVEMNTAAVTDADSATPIVGPVSMTSCMGVAIFNPARKRGGAVHAAQDPNDPLRLSPESAAAIRELIAASRSSDAEPLEVRLMGPKLTGFEKIFVTEVVDILNQAPNVTFLSADMLGKNSVTAFGVDTRKWDQGLLKGSNDSGISRFDAAKDIALMTKYIEAQKTVLELDEMPPCQPPENSRISNASAHTLEASPDAHHRIRHARRPGDSGIFNPSGGSSRTS